MLHQSLKIFSQRLGSFIESESIIEGFAVDTRNIKEGDVFFALKGERVDGHNYLAIAKEKKAIAAVVSMEYQGEDFGLPLIRVKDVLGSLQTLAREEMSKRSSKVIAVTGSVGKTTTKEYIATLLEKKFSVEKTPGNANSQIGVPLAILNLAGKAEYFISEMGMEHAGDIAGLVNIAPPDVAVVTKIGHAHVENFEEGIEGTAKAKSEIFLHPRTRLKIVNSECLQYAAIRDTGSGKIITFSSSGLAADYMLKKEGDGFYIQKREERSSLFTLPFNETHLMENFTAAAAVAKEMGLEWHEIFSQAQELKPFKLRFEKVQRDGVLYVNDCYNANPESMRAALKNLPKPKQGCTAIAVFGYMTGLGKLSKKCHEEVAEEALSCIDRILVLGELATPMIDVFSRKGKKAEFFPNLASLKQSLFGIAKPGDVVLIKGSNANNLWKILED